MSEPIALGLRQALESGDCVLFVGAGVGGHYRALDGTCAPDGGTLAKELADHFGIEAGDSPDLAKVAQIIEIRKKGRSELETFIKRRLADLEPDEIFSWLCTIRWKAIFTTNYDGAIQRAYAKNPDPPQTPVTITATGELVSFDRRFQVPVFHLHGALFGVERPRIIITEDDYVQFRHCRRMLFEILKQEFATSTFLYIGYSNRDPNWRLLLVMIDVRLSVSTYSGVSPKSRLIPLISEFQRCILKQAKTRRLRRDVQACRFSVPSAAEFAWTKSL